MTTIQTASPRATTPAGRYVIQETLLGIVINILMAGLVTALTNRAEAFNGASLAYVASDMAKATIIPILAFGLGLTLVTRKRLATGAVAPPARTWGTWAPRNLVLRLALLAAVALMILGAPGTYALHALGAAGVLTPTRLMMFKLAYGAVIGIVATPVVLVLALCDAPAALKPLA